MDTLSEGEAVQTKGRQEESASTQALAASNRQSDGMRWFNILVRTCHIGVSAVLFGGCVLLVPFARLTFWHHLTIASGCVLLGLEWLHDKRWPHRNKGLLAIVHVSLAIGIHLHPELIVPLLWMILVSGCIGSHMPYKYRNWSFRDGLQRRDD